MKHILILSSIIAILLLAGCGNKEYKPKEISVETDVCEICNMTISHLDYAGQIVFKNNDYLVFDDLGCLMEYIIDHGESEIGAAYIKDESTNEWINVKEAVYIYEANYWTPMNYGVLAFASRESADAYMSKNGQGKQLGYKDLFTFEWGIHTDE
jgi:copper chaperone NosL